MQLDFFPYPCNIVVIVLIIIVILFIIYIAGIWAKIIPAPGESRPSGKGDEPDPDDT
jgi:hypothetical protein